MKRMHLLTYVAAFTFTGMAQPSSADGLAVYPVTGVYGFERTACDTTEAQGRETAKIARDFCDYLSPERRRVIGQRFVDRVSASFPGVIQKFGQNVGEGERPEARLSKTVIASLHLSRADLWVVRKPASLDIYVPITLSLFMTNALSGEVMFVDNYSTIVQGNLSADHYLEQARRELGKAIDTSVDALVADAAGRFKPYAIAGQIRAQAGDKYIFDRGRRGGVREGNVIGADAKVLFSDAEYSVVAPVLHDLKVGQTLSRQAVQPVDVLAKPSALVVVAHYPEGTSQGFINAVFEDAVGQGSVLAIAPINQSFIALRSMMLGEANLPSSFEDKRPTPDYFIRLSVFVLDPLNLETNVAHARRAEFEARALVEVIDHSGRVIFATQAANRIEDQVLFGVAFSPDQRRDTVIHNALLQAAANLNKGFKPARLRLDVKPAGGEVDVTDAGGSLSIGSKAILIRKFGNVAGITGDVWTPAGDLEVTDISAGGVHARFEDPEPRTARAGDKASFDGGTNSAESRRQYAPCEDAEGRPIARNKGTVEQPLFREIALNTFAAGFPAPFRLAHFDSELSGMLSQFSDASELGVMHPKPAEVCVEPVYQIDLTGEKPGGEGLVSPIYRVAMGYSLRQNGQRIGAGAQWQSVTGTGVPSTADPSVRLTALQFDLGTIAENLTTQVVRNLKP